MSNKKLSIFSFQFSVNFQFLNYQAHIIDNWKLVTEN
ncbi:MAG: hypothetical protein UX60_C0015G0005 [Berkelbacteria bacterium GW2011_GWA2_46_7]|uniref:Uncharacterized protein n=1 Tax=Berkelbacteria bacterium GW2011_GWA2_46_7 TaxID=1618335 RepID=A0A0G1QFW0_9BACT|nr:MAG: hypothetical protein UX60_C0015G0005 [Berkelbacteria bacterium GW2011_GWA2_46_7]